MAKKTENPAQKQSRMILCQKHLTHYEKEGIAFLQRIIAIHETWVRDFKHKLKSQCEVLKGKKFAEAAKIPTPSFESGTNDNNRLRLYWYNRQIHGAIWSCSGSACVRTLSSQNFNA